MSSSGMQTYMQLEHTHTDTHTHTTSTSLKSFLIFPVCFSYLKVMPDQLSVTIDWLVTSRIFYKWTTYALYYFCNSLSFSIIILRITPLTNCSGEEEVGGGENWRFKVLYRKW